MGSCVQPLFSSNFARFRGHCQYSGKPFSKAGAGTFVPRPHQIEASKAIPAAHRTGRPRFLLSDMIGLGKTLATWLAVADMPETEILIVCPKGAVAQDHTSLRFTTQGCHGHQLWADQISSVFASRLD
jgi:superfamily II DNA or RNA helicase